MSADRSSEFTNSELARKVVQTCWNAGCREFVLCAGSRNSPLVLELLELELVTADLKIWNFFEERSAAFFALGRSKITGVPTAVVTTSGTAAAELFPAVIEAHYSGEPLILVTADRPPSFRGSGAPQAIDQENMFGENVELFIDVGVHSHGELDDLYTFQEQSQSDLRWHINVAFDEPLVSVGEGDRVGALKGGEAFANRSAEDWDDWNDWEIGKYFCDQGGAGVVVLGYLSGSDRSPELVEALRELAWPIWADACSGLREDESIKSLIINDEPLFFTDYKEKETARVLRIGGVPSLRFWRDLEDLEGIEVLSLRPPGGFSGLGRISSVMKDDVVQTLRKILEQEKAQDLEATGHDAARIEALLEKYPHSEPTWMKELSTLIPQQSLVFLGNSMPIREWNLAATFDDRALRCYASRGANGIDGQISTFLGLSANEGESWAVFGDLTTLYDLSAPWVMKQLKSGKRRLVVLNNGGGRIFSRLPHLAGLSGEKKLVMENHHQTHFEHWAAMWGLTYLKVTKTEELSLDKIAAEDSILIELCPDLEQTEAFWKDLATTD